MKTDNFNCENYSDFADKFKDIFKNTEGKIQFVECPVRMGKTYHVEQYIINFLKKKNELEKEIVIFATEKNLLVDSSFLQIKKFISKSEELDLLIFKKETSTNSMAFLKSRLSQESFKIACLSSFTYLTGRRISDFLSSLYSTNAKITIIIVLEKYIAGRNFHRQVITFYYRTFFKCAA